MHKKALSNIPTKTLSIFNQTFSNNFTSRNARREKLFEPFFSNTTTSNFYTAMSPNHNFNEPLENLYNNSYYPRTLRSPKFNKTNNASLPTLTQINFHNVVSEPKYDIVIKKYKTIYNNQDEMNYLDDKSETVNKIISNNKITGDESEFIKKVTKRNKKKGLKIDSQNDAFSSPKNALMTLKINKALMDRMNCVMSSKQYESYNKLYNKVQFDKLVSNIMPKPHVKLLQMNNENENKYGNLFNNANTSNKSINDILIRNGLIKGTKYYYCKTIAQNNRIPNSRVQATFTKYLNLIYLYGGLSSSVLNDFWTFDIATCKWKQQMLTNSNIAYNFKYGHSSILYNDNLYFFGGNLNVNKIKYPLEDILIYNLRNKTLKIANFKREFGRFDKKYFRIPYRRNHICEVIGWNMVVHGGIDIEKEYSNKNDDMFFLPDQINTSKNDNNVLCDFMMLDLNSLKWIKLDDIRYKIRSKGKKKLRELKRAYHCSCLVLNNDNLLKGMNLNIFHSEFTRDQNAILSPNDPNKNKHVFDPKYEGIYMFGGLDENLKPTNSLYIIHIFKNPLVLFEPNCKGNPPSPRFSSTLNYYKGLNYIVLYGGKNLDYVFNDLFILDIMNFNWISVDLYGSINEKRAEHCSEIIGDKLIIFGGCNETNFLNSKVFIVELDLFKNKRYKKILDFAKENLKVDSGDRIANMVVDKISRGEDIPNDIYPFLSIEDTSG